MPLEPSGLFVVSCARWNSWQLKSSLPFVSHATEGSPLAWKYSRATPPNAVPRTKPLGKVTS